MNERQNSEKGAGEGEQERALMRKHGVARNDEEGSVNWEDTQEVLGEGETSRRGMKNVRVE
jgi:hypothetical protein